jgi:hypothetical protein
MLKFMTHMINMPRISVMARFLPFQREGKREHTTARTKRLVWDDVGSRPHFVERHTHLQPLLSPLNLACETSCMPIE